MKILLKKAAICSLLIIACSIACSHTAAEAKKIQNASQAEAEALKKVPSATVTEVDTDTDNGVLVYEVELYKNGREYNLEFRASDGKLIKYEWEIANPSYTSQDAKDLSKSSIEQKALKKVKNATVVSTTLTYDDGMVQYKVKLKKGSKKYKLVYDSKTGKLLEYEWEIAETQSSSGQYIGTEKAKAIALEKVPNATIVKVEFEKDDGVAVYEVEMVKGIYEYEVKIDAKTGTILEFEKDIND